MPQSARSPRSMQVLAHDALAGPWRAQEACLRLAQAPAPASGCGGGAGEAASGGARGSDRRD
eukprot:3100768-Alexandrium_andersonii.AAC.1